MGKVWSPVDGDDVFSASDARQLAAALIGTHLRIWHSRLKRFPFSSPCELQDASGKALKSKGGIGHTLSPLTLAPPAPGDGCGRRGSAWMR